MATPLERRIMLPITVLCLLAVAGAGVSAFLLEVSAEGARAREAAVTEAGLIAAAAQEAGAGAPACLSQWMGVLLVTKSELAYLRAQDGQGSVLAEVGDRGRAEGWIDRTYGGPAGPVRVQVGYRERPRPLAWGIRTAVWTALAGSFAVGLLATLSVLLRRHAVKSRDE